MVRMAHCMFLIFTKKTRHCGGAGVTSDNDSHGFWRILATPATPAKPSKHEPRSQTAFGTGTFEAIKACAWLAGEALRTMVMF